MRESTPAPPRDPGARRRRRAAILRALRINLTARDYDGQYRRDGAAGLAAMARDRPDVIILDLGLPDMDGTEVIRGVRGWTSTPIIVLSVWGQESQKVAALDAGADDYVTKPFGMDELLARLRAAIRRASPAPDEPVVRPGTSPSISRRSGSPADGRELRLTPTEWQLLEILVRNRGRLVTQRQLLQEVWGPTYETESNYLRVYVAQLRRKLEPEPVAAALPAHRVRHGLPPAGRISVLVRHHFAAARDR